MRKLIPNIAAIIMPVCVRERLYPAPREKSVYVQNIPHKVCRALGCYCARHLDTKCYQHTINRYMAASILMLQDTLQYCTVSTSSYRSLSRLLPFLANTVPSYLLLVLVHRSGLRGHRFSRLFDCCLSGHIKDIICRHKSQTRE
jgi:branched-subunit amino acid transport protein AzlD